MPTTDNKDFGMIINGEPIVDDWDIEISEVSTEDPAKEDEFVPYFNDLPEMTLQGEIHLSKKEKRKLDKMYKKTIGRLKMRKRKIEKPEAEVRAIMGNNKPMREREINKKLKQHNKFLTTGKGKAADFSNALLYQVDLSGVNLSEACFRGTTFWAVKFNGADLAAADFTGAHFITTDVSDADLSNACLKGITVDEIFTNENTKISVPLFLSIFRVIYRMEKSVLWGS